MKDQRKRLFLLLTALIVAVTVATITLRGQDQKTASTDQEMTGKQKEHSKLYKEYKTGKKLSELVTEIGDVRIRRNTPLSGGDPGAHNVDAHEFLRGMICEADAVVVGKVKSQLSQISEDEDFVFSDYEMSVAEVLKDNAAVHIQPNTTITITRPGGMIRLNGRTVEATDDSFGPFTVEGQYLLFLRFIPVTGAYKATGSKSSFQLRGKAITKLTKEALPLDDEIKSKDVDSFVNEIRLALASGCTNLLDGDGQ